MISLPRASDDSVAGVIIGIRTGTVADVLEDGIAIGFRTVGGEISGEKSLPLQVTLLDPTMLLTSVSTSPTFKSCLIP